MRLREVNVLSRVFNSTDTWKLSHAYDAHDCIEVDVPCAAFVRRTYKGVM
jgi:hypothetical protein